jgi:hypothetical protein
MQRLKHILWRCTDIATHQNLAQIECDGVVVDSIELKALDPAFRQDPDPHARLERCGASFAGALREVIPKLACLLVIGGKALRYSTFCATTVEVPAPKLAPNNPVAAPSDQKTRFHQAR